MTPISDRGDLDFLTPDAEPSDVDRAIADAVRAAMAEQRSYLNTRDRLRRERSTSRMHNNNEVSP